jgi:CHAT domain-containing protein
MPGDQRERLQRAVQRGSKTSAAEVPESQDAQHPFAHPYFWAGFVYTGE